jgi:hypothetical protein
MISAMAMAYDSAEDYLIRARSAGAFSQHPRRQKSIELLVRNALREPSVGACKSNPSGEAR